MRHSSERGDEGDPGAAIRHEAVELLADLVATDSQNPGLTPGGAGESAIADYLETWAHSHELRSERLESTPGRPSVIITAPGTGNGRRLMLCGDLDTVGGDEAGLDPRIDGDRMYGRGTYDMKAGLTAALLAARQAARAGLAGDVLVAAVADEEDASLGAIEMLRSVGADAAVVLEPTELVLATAHRGFIWIEVEVTGLAAHGSRPELGVDAITRMAPVISALDELNTELAEHRDPLVGHGFFHASTITGGREPSTIPDRCTLVVERRTIPGETAEGVMAAVTALLDRCRAQDPALTVSARVLLDRPPFVVSPAADVVRLVGAAGQEVLGRPLETGGAGYWADSALLAGAGIPTVLLGPVGDGAHAAQEWVSIASMVDCTRILSRAAELFCTAGPHPLESTA